MLFATPGGCAVTKLDADVCVLSDPALTDRLRELDGVIERAEAERLVVLGEWNDRMVWALDGAYGAAGWLAAREPLGRAAAAGLTRSAARLRKLTATREAMVSGRINAVKARLLAGGGDKRTPDGFRPDKAL